MFVFESDSIKVLTVFSLIMSSDLEQTSFAFVESSCIPFFLFDRSGFFGVNFGLGALIGLEFNASVVEPMKY